MIRAEKHRDYGTVEFGEPSNPDAKKPRVSATVQFEESANPEAKRIDRTNPNQKFRGFMLHRFAVFQIRFKIAEEHRHRNLYCIITVDDNDHSEDIYHGALPKDDMYRDLLLNGPQNFIEAYDQIYFVVAIFDVDDSKSSALMANALACDHRKKSCGTFPVKSIEGKSDWGGSLLWTWNSLVPNKYPFDKICSVDLIKEECGGMWRKEPVAAQSYGSLILKYAAFRDSVVAKVEVHVLKETSHHICKGVCGGEITAHCNSYEESIVLFRNIASDCSCKTSEESQSEDLFFSLPLSRSLVTVPSTASVFTLRFNLIGRSNHDIVNSFAEFSVQISGTSQKLIYGWSGTILQVTVAWT